MQLTLSSDPRVWMGGGIPTRWRRHNRDGWENRDRRDGRLSFQIDTYHPRKCSKSHHFRVLIVRSTIAIWATGGLKSAYVGLLATLCWVGEGGKRPAKVLVFAYLQHCAGLGRVVKCLLTTLGWVGLGRVGSEWMTVAQRALRGR